jgi:hypothetical protein
MQHLPVLSINLQALRRQLQEVFQSFPEVTAVFLFGSRAEGRAGVESDLDLAIVSTGPLLREHRLELLAALVSVGLDNVDVVFLDTGDVVLRYEAVRPNCLVYAREDFDRGGFYTQVLREYLDFLPYLTIQREAIKRRLLSDPT